MADNTRLSAGTGDGDTIRDVDKGGKKTQVVALDLGGAGAESLLTTAMPVTGTFWQATQPISTASLPLPSGAATAAKQPALGTAGTAATDVITVQGIASMTALKVDGSAVTQPVSGTLTVNAGTNLNTSSLALESGGHLAAIDGKVPGLGQALAAASVPVVLTAAQITTLTPPSTVGVTGTFWQATQPVSVASAVTVAQATASSLNATVVGTGTFAVQAAQSGSWNARIQDGSGNALTSLSTGSQRPLSVAIVDGSGSQVTSFGGSGGTASNFGSAFPSTGTAIGAKDSAGTNLAALNLDASGFLKVNVAAGGAGDGSILDGVSGAIKATVLDYTNSNPLAVRLTDTGGDYVAAGAGTQYTEDAAAASDPIGGMLLGRRRDTLSTSEVSADGDNIALNATNKGQLHVKLADTVVVDGSGVTQPVSGTFWQTTQPVSGTFWQATQPVSIASAVTVAQATASSLNATVVGTGTFAVQATIAAGATSVAKAEDVASADADVGVPAMAIRKGTPANTSGTDGDYEMLQMSAGRLWVDASGKTLTVDGSGVTQPISAASLPLPSGASTSAKQPALGTAGTASSDVLTVQGIASMTALKVDASATTQPVSGTITANAGTNLNTSSLALDATLTGGTQKSKLVDSGGTNVATVSSGGALKVDGSAATQPVSGTVTINAIPAGTNLIGQTAASPETSTVYNGTTALTPKFATFSTSSSGATTVVALVGGKRIRVLRWRCTSNGTTNVKWQSHSGSPADLSGLSYLTQFAQAGGSYCPVGCFQTVSGEALDINNSAAVAISGEVTYVEV